MTFNIDFYSGNFVTRILPRLFGYAGRHASESVHYCDHEISHSLAIFVSLFEWNPASDLGYWPLVDNKGGQLVRIHYCSPRSCLGDSSYIFIETKK